MAKLKLSQVPVGSIFEDSSSKKYKDGTTPLQWVVVGQDADGDNTTTLILLNSPAQRTDMNLCFDAKEPTNPDATIRDNGNPYYRFSNILQWLNSDVKGADWFVPTHEYDQKPISPYASSYAASLFNIGGFLCNCSEDFKASLKSVTKYGVSKKVHLPSIKEFAPDGWSTNSKTGTSYLHATFDEGGVDYNAYEDAYFEMYTNREYFARGDAIPQSGYDYDGRHPLMSNPSSLVRLEETTDSLPYDHSAYAYVMPMTFMDSNIYVEYNTSSNIYYASWNVAPVVTVQDIGLWQDSPFNIVFKVQDDIELHPVSTTVKLDETTLYTNASTPIGNNITVSTSSVFDSLEYREHIVTITADDGDKITTIQKTFKKAKVAPTVLYSVSENRVFVDRNTILDGEPIEWLIAAKDIEGKNVVALMAKKPLVNYCFDAREVYNPDSQRANYGNTDYATSNIIQWLNSDGAANEWYENQHQYDYPPNSADVGGTYATKDGFMHNFSSTLKSNMKTVTKMGVAKKVHIPSFTELIGDSSYGMQSGYYLEHFDSEVKYLNFNGMSQFYKALVTSQYPSAIPWINVRSHAEREVGALGFRTTKTGYNWFDQYGLSGQNPNYTNSTYPGYTIPVIYLAGDNIPVVYDSETLTYYLDYALSTQYGDYGKHKDGFDIKVKIDCSTPIGDTVVKFYIDDNPIEVYTTTISTYNEYVSVTLPDSAVEDLENGEHIITIKSDTYGILGSTSTKYTKVDESVPIILTDDIGHIVEPFNMTYQVYDDDGDSLNVTIKLDGTVISTITDAEQNVDLPLALTTAQFNNINYGDHTIVIEATDGVNTSTATLPFTKNSVPTIELDVHELDVQLEPFSVEVTTNSADGENITVRAYIDNQEITV